MDIKVIVSAIIGVIILSAVAVPIIDSMSDQITARNNAIATYTATDTIENTVVELTESGYKINDYVIPASQLVKSSRIIVMSDKFVLESGTNPNISMVFTPIDTGVTVSISRIEISDSGYTYTPISGDAVTASSTIQFLIHPSAKGDLTYVAGTTYVDPDSKIYFFSTYRVGSNMEHIIGSGTINNPNVIMESEATDIVPKIQTEGSNPTKFIAAQVSFKVAEQTYYVADASHVFVPVQYHMESANDKTVMTLVSLVPVLLAVAMIVGIAYTVVAKRE